MPRYGALKSDKDVVAHLSDLLPIRAGQVTVQVSDTTKQVVFEVPMQSAEYQVVLESNGLLGTFTVTSKTTDGFTINLPGVQGVVGYIAVANT